MTEGARPDWNEAQLENWPCLFGQCGNSYPPEWLRIGPLAEIGGRVYEQSEVAEVAAAHYHDDDGGSGEGNEPEMWAVVRFVDGKWASVNGGADYTGWGCQDGVTWRVGDTREAVERFGLTDEARRLLGIALDP